MLKYLRKILFIILAWLALPLSVLAATGGGFSINASDRGFGFSLGFGSGGANGGGGGWLLGNLSGFGLPENSIIAIVENLLAWLLAIFGIVGIIGFLISGIMYLVAAGNDVIMGKAKNAMLYSIYGVVVGLSGLVVIMAINAALRGQFF